MKERITLNIEQQSLAKKLGISEDFLRLLLMRGVTEADIPAFLNPSLDNMCSPYAIDGMKEAVDRLRIAIENKQKVLVFGDYDCDGIGAVSILVLHLRDKLNIDYFVPDRNKDGYGLSIEALKMIVKRRRPDLVITVDCGITAVDEVEYLKSECIDVIVTDHHEPQEILPDCIIVDPKVKKEGFYDFCGAGVALKLVEGIAGKEEMKKYLDIAAISTIADVVPLRNDNRIIAHFGLKQIFSQPRKFIKYLLDTDKLTSHDIMFKLAPRLNAAGRLSSATKAVELFLEDDPSIIRSIAESLNRDNLRRQEICERVVDEAKKMLKGIDFDKTRIIVLSSPGWEAGVIGIAAARLADEFKCPAILFNEKNGELKGSARSVKSVNIFEMLSQFSSLFVTFGGHSQAAGVTLKSENYASFKEGICEEMLRRYSADEFLPKTEYDMELDPDVDQLPFAKELERLEPTGYGNPQPVFLVKGENLRFDRIGFSKHIKCTTKGLELVGFSKFSYCLGVTRGKVEIALTLSVNSYQNRLYAQGIIKSFCADTIAIYEEESRANCIHQLEHEGDISLPELDIIAAESMLDKPFGTMFVCFTKSEYDALCASSPRIAELPVLIATPRCLNPENCVLISPAEIFDFSFYRTVIIAGRAFSKGYIKHIASQTKQCYTLGDCSVREVAIPDRAFRELFPELRTIANKNMRLQNTARFYQLATAKVKMSFFDFSVICRVFSDLGLLSMSDKGMISVSNARTELSKSAIYRNIKH